MSQRKSIDTPGAFFSLLEASKLLSPEQMQEVRTTYAKVDDPRTIARRMARAGRVTTWQGEQLLAGRNNFRFGEYTLLSRIGKGSMGAVFEARHKSHKRSVALKIMAKSVLGDATKVARFQREMRSIARLNHPNIIAYVDSGKQGSVHYLAMEYARGRDLRQLIKGHGVLPVDFACEIIRQAALALQHAHENGILHRDIKPDNLLVTLDSECRPRIKLLDLGLARVSDDEVEANLTMSGQVVGTPNYVAPEVLSNPQGADIRADIYSLGSTLFRALTKKLPFTGETAMEKMLNKVKNDAPSVLEYRPEVPPIVAAVAAKALSRDPSKRYQTPDEFAHALEPFCWKPGQPLPDVNLEPQAPEEADAEVVDAELEGEFAPPVPPPPPGGAVSKPAGSKPPVAEKPAAAATPRVPSATSPNGSGETIEKRKPPAAAVKRKPPVAAEQRKPPVEEPQKPPVAPQFEQEPRARVAQVQSVAEGNEQESFPGIRISNSTPAARPRRPSLLAGLFGVVSKWFSAGDGDDGP